MRKKLEDFEDGQLQLQGGLVHLDNGSEPAVQFPVERLVRSRPKGQRLPLIDQQQLPLFGEIEKPLRPSWVSGVPSRESGAPFQESGDPTQESILLLVLLSLL